MKYTSPAGPPMSRMKPFSEQLQTPRRYSEEELDAMLGRNGERIAVEPAERRDKEIYVDEPEEMEPIEEYESSPDEEAMAAEDKVEVVQLEQLREEIDRQQPPDVVTVE